MGSRQSQQIKTEKSMQKKFKKLFETIKDHDFHKVRALLQNMRFRDAFYLFICALQTGDTAIIDKFQFHWSKWMCIDVVQEIGEICLVISYSDSNFRPKNTFYFHDPIVIAHVTPLSMFLKTRFERLINGYPSVILTLVTILCEMTPDNRNQCVEKFMKVWRQHDLVLLFEQLLKNDKYDENWSKTAIRLRKKDVLRVLREFKLNKGHSPKKTTTNETKVKPSVLELKPINLNAKDDLTSYNNMKTMELKTTFGPSAPDLNRAKYESREKITEGNNGKTKEESENSEREGESNYNDDEYEDMGPGYEPGYYSNHLKKQSLSYLFENY